MQDAGTITGGTARTVKVPLDFLGARQTYDIGDTPTSDYKDPSTLVPSGRVW